MKKKKSSIGVKQRGPRKRVLRFDCLVCFDTLGRIARPAWFDNELYIENETGKYLFVLKKTSNSQIQVNVEIVQVTLLIQVIQVAIFAVPISYPSI